MHKYDHLYRLLADQQVVIAQTIREAELQGIEKTVRKLKDMLASSARITDNVMARIEADHVAMLMERDAAALEPGRDGTVNVNPPPTGPRPPPPPPPRTDNESALFSLPHAGSAFPAMPNVDLFAALSRKDETPAEPPTPPSEPPAPESGGGSFDGGGASGDY